MALLRSRMEGNSMNRLLSAIAMLSTMFAASQAVAGDSNRLSTLNVRQIKVCMAKRMVADRTIADNEAKKVCAEQLRARNETSAPTLSATSRSH
jgi:hypothetical protein